jgi:hypothetical protein
VPHDREARTREERPFSGHSRGNTEPRTYREQREPEEKPGERRLDRERKTDIYRERERLLRAEESKR